MATLTLPRALDGSLIPLGRVSKTISANFMWDTALPSWLTLAAGTAEFTSLDTSQGRVRVTTDASTGAAARLETTAGIDISLAESIRWDIEGFATSDVGTGINFTAGLAGASAGVSFVQTGNAATGVTANGVGATSAALTSNANVINLGEGNRSKNFSFLLLPRLKHAYYLESDQVGADWDLTGTGRLPSGVVKPSIGITTRTAAAKVMRITRISLTITSN